jgi:plastocyanin
MMRAWRYVAISALVAGLLTSCGGGGGNGGGPPTASGSKGGEERTVLVDFRHDEFASAFFGYYPSHLKIRPGDTVQFRQAWTGEPHSVTFGKVVDDFIELLPEIGEYPTPADALAAGVSKEVVDRVSDAYERLPAMVSGYDVSRAGSEGCFVADAADVPIVRSLETDETDPSVPCPEADKRQPAFNGRQALYDSGFIPYNGPRGNSFTVPIAKDATPGTYRFFCNYHFIFMQGEIEIVPPGSAIPSEQQVRKEAREEVQSQAVKALAAVRKVEKLPVGARVGSVAVPLAGKAVSEDPDDFSPVIINEFFPRTIQAKVGQPVRWDFDGWGHTVSFNVPKYFPIFTVDKETGRVQWDPKSHEPVGWDLPERETFRQEESPPPADLDAGTWDGKGGFHSSGALNPGDSFTVTFTRTGTYPYACVLHPQMVGTVQVS